MKFRPIHDRVLLRRLEERRKTPGGIIIPDTLGKAPRSRSGRCGPGVRGEDGRAAPPRRRAGDRVLFGKWSGTGVKIDARTSSSMKESDIMGVFDQTRRQAQAAKGSD